VRVRQDDPGAGEGDGVKNITIKFIPASKQRYDTAGDYWFDKRGGIQVRISKFRARRDEILVLIHELTEMLLCLEHGVSFAAIDRFDMAFKGDGEPGDDPKAPYCRQHRFAMRIEELLARELQKGAKRKRPKAK
jgi:hypothetical protein